MDTGKYMKKDRSARQDLCTKGGREGVGGDVKPRRQIEVASPQRQRPFTGSRNVQQRTLVQSQLANSSAAQIGQINRVDSKAHSVVQKAVIVQSSAEKTVKRVSSGRQTAAGWQATRTTQGDTDTLAHQTVTVNNSTLKSLAGSRARSANPARRFKNREIDLNDPMIFEIIKRDRKPKKPTVVEHSAMLNHSIFEGLDNSRLLSNSALAKTTYTDIFGHVTSQSATPATNKQGAAAAKVNGIGRRKASVDSLKKKMHYVNFSRQNFDLINSRQLGQIYQKFNKERIFNYEDNRSQNFQAALKRDNQNVKDAKRLNLGGPKGLQEFKKAMQTNHDLLQQGDLSVNEFVKRTRPLLERSEFESQNKIRQNILSIKNGGVAAQRRVIAAKNVHPSQQQQQREDQKSMLNQENVTKRMKRMEKIEQACRMLDKNSQHSTQTTLGQRPNMKSVFNNQIIKIVSRTHRSRKENCATRADQEAPSQITSPSQMQQAVASQGDNVAPSSNISRHATPVEPLHQRDGPSQRLTVRSLAKFAEESKDIKQDREVASRIGSETHEIVLSVRQPPQPLVCNALDATSGRSKFNSQNRLFSAQSRNTKRLVTWCNSDLESTSQLSRPASTRQLSIKTNEKDNTLLRSQQSQRNMSQMLNQRLHSVASRERFNESQIDDYRSNTAHTQQKPRGRSAQKSAFSLSRSPQPPLDKTIPSKLADYESRGRCSMLKYILGAPIARQAEQAMISVERARKEKLQRERNQKEGGVDGGHEDDKKSVVSQRTTTNENLASRRREVMEKRRRNASTCMGVKCRGLLLDEKTEKHSDLPQRSITPTVASRPTQMAATVVRGERSVASATKSKSGITTKVQFSRRTTVLSKRSSVGLSASKVDQNQRNLSEMNITEADSDVQLKNREDKLFDYAIDCLQKLKVKRSQTIKSSKTKAKSMAKKSSLLQTPSKDQKSAKHAIAEKQYESAVSVRQLQKPSDVQLSQSPAGSTLIKPKKEGDGGEEPVCTCGKNQQASAGKQGRAKSQLDALRSKILRTGRRQTVTINRPAVPHLHLVDLRPEEKIIDGVLFSKGRAGAPESGVQKPTMQVKELRKPH